ncbi:FMN-binding protein [Aminipila butyrica]|uniref:FMN-binding protein n=1 Tax=Aminipila butyrica TaxID=433296 RepID=A0A858BVC9_9FIRM|nr:S-layer homology domain-containing protein [Aminipila butyrica]QIB68724.1 FMN-binding protein [Aminipila butyrica]
MKLSYLKKNKKKIVGVMMAMIVAISSATSVAPVFADDADLQVPILEAEEGVQTNEDVGGGESPGNSENTPETEITTEKETEEQLPEVKEEENKSEDVQQEEDQELAEAAFNLISLQSITLSGDYTDGKYEGTGAGRNGAIVLNVTIAENKITEIEVVSQSETANLWEKAKALFDTIIEANSTAVDGVTGATYSSNGIKGAVNDALSKAIKDETKVFEKGSGSKSNPYIIKTDNQLQRFADKVNEKNDYEGKYIALSSNIELSGEWTPIGTKDAPFAGQFSGEGNTIDGLTIKNSNQYAGLFGYLGNGAEISDIKLTNVHISEEAKAVYAGGIVGMTGENITIDNCAVSGSVFSNTTADNASSYAGGVAGNLSASSIVSNVCTDVTVTAYAEKALSYAGGITGISGNKCILLNAASQGTIIAESDGENKNTVAGGVSGMLAGTAYNVFSRCTVSAENSVESKKFIGGISGVITPNTALINGYYNSSITKPYMLFVPTISGYVADHIVVMDDVAFDSADFVATMNDGLLNAKISTAASKVAAASNANMGDLLSAVNNVEGVYAWKLDGGIKLSDEKFIDDTIDTSIFERGSGTENNPYIIKTEAQLRNFALSVTDTVSYKGIYIALDGDIDVSSAVWLPIGLGHSDFLGTFDGKGYKITGMHIGEKGNPYQEPSGDSTDKTKMTTYYGLFGVIGENAVIKNLGIEDAVISAEKEFSLYAGLLAAVTDKAYIDSCYAEGYVYSKINNKSGNAWAGGLVGMTIKGGVINSWTDAEVYCEAVGGLAESGSFIGMSNRTVVANCLALGLAGGKASRENGNEGMPAVSSFIGVNGGKMANCYSMGDMKADSFSTYVGAVSGWATGIARQFISYYNADAIQNSNGIVNNPVISVGFMVSAGVNDEGEPYDGTYNVGIESKAKTFLQSQAFAELLNSNFSAFPLDIVSGKSSNTDDKDGQNAMGLPSFMKLKSWQLVGSDVLPIGEPVLTTYKDMNPIFEPDTLEVVDGTYYGRAKGPSGQYIYVQMTVKNKRMTEISVTSHNEGEALDAVSHEVITGVLESQSYAQSGSDSTLVKALKSAIAVAAQKAAIRDLTNYGNASDSIFASGSGTEKNPYLISTANQLKAFAESINADEHYEGKYIKLTSDISLQGMSWIPAGGSGAYGFRGTFDGNNKVISNMTIGSEANPEMYCKSVGLFANLEAAVVKNLGMEKAQIYHRYLGDSIAYAGILSGYYIQNSGDHGSIDFCYAKGTVNSYSAKQNDAAGLIGNINKGIIANSYVDVTVNSQSRDGYSYAGGICGLPNRSLIINCYALGSVKGTGNGARIQVGGISGMNAGIEINNYADVTLASANTVNDVGGITGRVTGIGYIEKAYYNKGASQVSGSQVFSPAKGIGTIVSGAELGKGTVIALEEKTLAELKSTSFADLLNSNKSDGELISRTKAVLNGYGVELSSDITLRDFAYSSRDGGVVFKDRVTKSSGGGSKGGSSGGSKTNDTTNKTETPIDNNSEKNENTENNTASKVFADTQSHWAAEAINTVVERKIFTGVAKNEFSPNTGMTRAMFVTAIGRLANADVVENATFADVQSGTWYSGYVGWASQQKIISGISSSEFGINENITREQMAVMLYNLAKSQGFELAEGSAVTFTDNEAINDWAKTAVSSMVQAGVISGRDDLSFDPQQKATRAEAAAMISRFMEKYNI